MKEKPYGLNIRKNLLQLTRRSWSIGTLYFHLDRLEKRGILKSYPAQPSQDRGNSRKRLYDFTKQGSEQIMDFLAQEQNTKEK
jgi:DNA-binding PadR family transcriptional regulator